jgi:hypothetical protein
MFAAIRRASSRARYYAERVTRRDQQNLLVPVVSSGAQ